MPIVILASRHHGAQAPHSHSALHQSALFCPSIRASSLHPRVQRSAVSTCGQTAGQIGGLPILSSGMCGVLSCADPHKLMSGDLLRCHIARIA